MSEILILSKVQSAQLEITSPAPLRNMVITDAKGAQLALPVLKEVVKEGKNVLTLDASALAPWSPNHPVLYTLTAEGGVSERFGFRDLAPRANQAILLNGSPVFMRGYIRGIIAHEHPNMTGGSLKDAAVKNIRQAKKYGFNLVRFHSTIPTEDFVNAADEEGMLIHMEIGFVYDSPMGTPGRKLSMDNQNWRDTLLKYRNHPSCAIFCIGNEMHNSGHYPEVKALYDLGKELAPGSLIMDNSGWGEFDRSSADIFSQHIAYYYPYKHHQEMFRTDDCWRLNGSSFDEPLMAESKTSLGRARVRREAVPVRPTLAHEAIHYIEIIDYEKLNKKFDDFAAKVGPEYLAANEIKKPRFLTELPELIRRKGLTEKMPDYMKSSELFKMLGIKTYLERLRLSGLCGFEMLQFADCLKYENKNGIVDCFDDDKFIPAQWMREFNSDAALVADFSDDVFFEDETVKVGIYCSNFLEQPRISGDLELAVECGGKSEVIYSGHHLELAGGLQLAARLEWLPEATGTTRCVTLRAKFRSADVNLENAWDFFVYPRPVLNVRPQMDLSDCALKGFIAEHAAILPESENVIVMDQFNDLVFQQLGKGKTVVLFYQRDRQHLGNYYLPGALDRFKPCIWDRGNNLGGTITNDDLQKTLGSGRYFSTNMRDLLEGGYKLCMDHFPGKVDELIFGADKPVRDRMKGINQKIKTFIDDDTLRDFCYLGAFRCGKGKIVFCTFSTERLNRPAPAAAFAWVINNAATIQPGAEIAPDAFRQFALDSSAKGVIREDVMNHFWEIDNKPVEDVLFWEASNVDLSKIH